jgi:acyl-CoA synthetase (AMP-forming)/AMP-acid ligase II
MSTALDSGWNASDRFAAMMPMFHTAQLNAFCTPAVIVGATTYVMRGFDPRAWLDLIERERITQVFGLPMMFRTALDHPSFKGRDLSSLKRAVYAMAPMPDALIRRCLDRFGSDFALLFGQNNPEATDTAFAHGWFHPGDVGRFGDDGLREHLDGYKVPKSVIVVDELPKTSTGKIQKNLVRERHASHYGG